MIVGTIRQVLVVGIIAPSVMIGSIAVHLSRDRALQSQLRADPSLVPAAVEEFLRLYTPYRGFARTATEDVVRCGRTIPAGEPIALVYASANRDEEVFDDAENFVIDRPNMKDSLAFGRGTHACVGAALARLELQVALEELLAAAPASRWRVSRSRRAFRKSARWWRRSLSRWRHEPHLPWRRRSRDGPRNL
jgi:cytochrome P450